MDVASGTILFLGTSLATENNLYSGCISFDGLSLYIFLLIGGRNAA